jgi:hypothetical protein
VRETTYGIEAEWHVGANTLINRLHSMGLSGCDNLHPYHCDCDNCCLNNGYAFRGQTDSSCSGEVISDILGTSRFYEAEHDGYNATALFKSLAEAAVEVDAEPGLTSGFHVHVSVEGVQISTMRQAVWQYLRWEPMLTRIAGGRWNDQRPNMNRSVRSQLNYYWRAQHGCDLTSASMGAVAPEDCEYLQRDLHNALMLTDRHSNLSIRQNHYPTWEFRLWNSTRAAWRMEMFVGLSRAFLDAGVLDRLATAPVPLRIRRPSTGIQNLAEVIAAEGYGVTAEYLMRQGRYLDTRAGEAPVSLTLV